MTEKLISLKEAADLLGITYSGIRHIRANNTDIFPVEAGKGTKGSPLYKESDFLPLKEQFGKVVIKKLDNNLANLFLTGRTAEIAGDCHAH
jgi:hypothetical protein